jgi:hypothetical protein
MLKVMRNSILTACFVSILGSISACGDDDDGTPAQRRGVGSACTADDECLEVGQRCLPFKGGYCGISDCTSDLECPAGSACVEHDDAKSYCFLICNDKPECNRHRPPDDEANCSANITFTDGNAQKACVPPS